MTAPDTARWGDDILTSDHIRGCQGREYQCTCGYDDAKDAEITRLRAEVADLRISVIAFCGPFAAEYARDRGYPHNHLHPHHYDILAKAGARMDDFVRVKLDEHA